MPGGVAGERPVKAVPYADADSRFNVGASLLAKAVCQAK
jgi:hypothetical protein